MTIPNLKRYFPEKRATQATILMALFFSLLLRWDYQFVYYKTYQVQPQETTWQILNQQIFHNPKLTRLSIQHLQETSNFDWDQIQANSSNGAGTTFKFRSNSISVIQPNGLSVIENFPILPIPMLRNHFHMIVFYNLLIIFMFFTSLQLVKENNYKLNIKILRINFSPVVISFALPATVILMALTMWTLMVRLSMFTFEIVK